MPSPPEMNPDEVDPDSWLHDLTVDDAARRREQRNDLDQLTRESFTLVDELRAIGASGTPLTVSTGGVQISGRLTSTGPDAVELREVDGATWLIVTAGIDAVRAPRPPESNPSTPVGRTSTQWLEQLRLLQAERRPVRLLTKDGVWRSGQLDAVGVDTITLISADGRSIELLAAQSVLVGLVSG